MFNNNNKIEFEELDHTARIKVIGVGGGGNNAINRMVEDGVQGVEFIVVNTDAQALSNSTAKVKVMIGERTTAGKGSGANPEIGKKAAKESEAKIRDLVAGADMVFIAAGMGGGTGTGATPLIAKHAKASGALTVAIVTSPFTFEGPKRNKQAREGLEELRKEVDSIIVVSNDKALHSLGELPIDQSFGEIDSIIRQSIQTITDLVAVPSLINLDFADVVTVMKDKGDAIIGIGQAVGNDKALQAAQIALDAPLIEGRIAGCKSAIVNIASGRQLSLHEINDVTLAIKNHTGEDVNILLGLTLNDYLEDQIIVSIIGTDYDRHTIAQPVNKYRFEKKYEPQVEEDEDDFEDDEVVHQEEPTKIRDYDSIQSNKQYDEDDDEDDIPAFLQD